MGAPCGIRRATRRLLVATIAALLASGFLVESAFAQLPLGLASNDAEPSLGTAVGTVTQALPTGQVTQQAAPVIQQTTEPVLTAVASVAQAAEPVLMAAQPVVQAAAPVLEAAQPVIEATAPVPEATAPLRETTSPLLESTAPRVGSSVPLAVPAAIAATDATAAAVASETPIAQPDSGSAMSFGAITDGPADVSPWASRERRLALGSRDREPGAGQLPPVGLIGAASTNATSGGHSAPSAKAAAPRRPAPNTPDGPVGLLVELSAAYGSSVLLLFVAALAALFLAAPVLGRRLRPIVALWPLPVPRASLERPG